MRNSTQNRIALMLGRGLHFLLQLLAIVGTAIAVALKSTLWQAQAASLAPVVSDGPSPTAQTTANMPQARLTVHYNTVFMKWLYFTFNKLLMCTHMDLPEKSGQTFRNYMSVPLGPDLVPTSEGTVGPPEQITANFRDITVGQWSNYTNISDLAWMTSISNDVEEYRKILAYQLGYTIDDLVMFMLDYLSQLDSRTNNQDSLNAPYGFSKNMLEQMPASLAGANVPFMNSGYYNGSIHWFFVGDLMIDNTNNSVVDIWKHTESGQARLETLGSDGEEPIKTLELFSAHWRPSNNQTQYANWQGSGKTAISTYLAGADALAFINFPNARHTKIDPKWQNMSLWAGKYTERTAFDPNGLIMGGTGYNCVVGVGPIPDNTSRARIARAVPVTS